MRLVAVSVGLPRDIEWRGEIVRTSTFKDPVPGRRRVSMVNIEGDRQSDLTVHGGPDKAVYAYPSEHYDWWRGELPGITLEWGAFGENLTTEGLVETEVSIGDRFRVGSAEFAVTQPRMPCFKLGARFGRADMVKRFEQAGRNGFYLRVLREGDIGAGDGIEPLSRDGRGLSVSQAARLHSGALVDPALLALASEHPGLPAGWRARFRKRLESAIA
jgi:MOSC domain-containing protein YiiM